MDAADALEVLQSQHRCVLATTRTDGHPQLSPVGAAALGGKVLISSREPAYKVRNIRRHPYASLCVFGDAFYGQPWVQVEGPARIISLPEAIEGLVALYRTISGEHPDWEDYRSAMVREQRVLIEITVERAGPDRAG